MFRFEPEPNLARQSEIFQIWIRPVEPPTAVFSLRLALFELDKLIRDGISEEDFERTRSYLSKYVNLLVKTRSADLGYAIDSQYYGIPDYGTYVRSSIAKLKREDVNRAIRKYMHIDKMQIVAVSDNAGDLKTKLTSGAPSPITYNSPKPADIMEEDKTVQSYPLNLGSDQVTIKPVEQVFQ